MAKNEGEATRQVSLLRVSVRAWRQRGSSAAITARGCIQRDLLNYVRRLMTHDNLVRACVDPRYSRTRRTRTLSDTSTKGNNHN